MRKTLAIIPARGGSKRIPRKNIKSFLGKPIIVYSIQTALKAKIFDEVIVSTDNEEIANISKRSGAAVPFLRSKQNSDDNATLTDIIGEVLTKYKKVGTSFDFFCCILPTAPFITSQQLIEGYSLVEKNTIDAVIPVTRFNYPIHRALIIEKNRLKMLWPKYMQTNSQKLPQTFHDSGQFYWIKTESFLKQKKIFMKNVLPIVIPESETHDIDTENDWKTAELKYKILCSIV